MGLACSQARLLTLTARKADCEYGISIDSMQKMALTREMSELSQDYYSRLQSKQIAYYANGKYNKMNYAYLMGYGSNYTALWNQDKHALKEDNSMILTDYKGQVVLSDDYAKAITSVLGPSAMNKDGRGGIYNFVTKRGLCRENARLSWTQVETGSAITWKYPSCVLLGDNSVGEFYSVAMTNNFQQADTGTKMIHIGRNTRSRIVSKGISAGKSQNAYRGLVRVAKAAENARNYSQCDSLLIGDKCGAHTFPVMDSKNPTAVIEHEATTSKISEEQLMYCRQRGLSTEDAVGLIVNGYAREVLAKLPMEFAVEAQKLLAINLEGSVG